MSTVLYHLYEVQKAAFWPTRVWTEAAAPLIEQMRDPLSLTPQGRAILATSELIERSTRTYEKPAFGIESITRDGVNYSVHEEDVLVKTFCKLKRFRRTRRGKDALLDDPKLLMVAPLSGHYATLLRDTVRSMAEHCEVYITDWINARDIPVSMGDFGFDDYINYIMEFLQFLEPNTHVMAVCQPSVPVLAAVSILAAEDESGQPRTMTLMGGPIDTRINPGEVNVFAQDQDIKWIEQNLTATVPLFYPGAGRHVCPGFMMLYGFMNMNIERHQKAMFDQFQHLVQGDEESATAHNRFYDEYRSVMDLPAKYFLESVDIAFKRHLLPKGELVWKRTPVHPEKIKKTALFTIEGERDDISCPGQTLAAQSLCSGLPKSMKKHLLQKDVGHYGLFNGRRWRNNIAPQVTKFIYDHND